MSMEKAFDLWRSATRAGGESVVFADRVSRTLPVLVACSAITVCTPETEPAVEESDSTADAWDGDDRRQGRDRRRRRSGGLRPVS